jgi:hypothetical protein
MMLTGESQTCVFQVEHEGVREGARMRLGNQAQGREGELSEASRGCCRGWQCAGPLRATSRFATRRLLPPRPRASGGSKFFRMNDER